MITTWQSTQENTNSCICKQEISKSECNIGKQKQFNILILSRRRVNFALQEMNPIGGDFKNYFSSTYGGDESVLNTPNQQCHRYVILS